MEDRFVCSQILAECCARQLDGRSPNELAVILEPKKHAGVDIVFEIDNVVRGSVIGPTGKPMAGVCVHLWQREQKDGYGHTDCTDESGKFEITSVPAGEYIAVVNIDGKLSSSEPFRSLFYPNVSDRERAVVITIGPGDAVNDINIVVPKLEETITIDGVLSYSDGSCGQEVGQVHIKQYRQEH